MRGPTLLLLLVALPDVATPRTAAATQGLLATDITQHIKSLVAIEAASPPAPATHDPRSLAQNIKAQIKPCWAPPKTSIDIVTTLAARYNPDGSLASRPVLVSQTPVPGDDGTLARKIATRAQRAVLHCSPLHLPATLYRGGWDDVDLKLHTVIP
jgi:hypothetical protein